MDKTIIKDLLVRGVIGITERERAQPQDILINITLYGDISAAGLSDDINDCINYRTIAKKTIAYVEKTARYTVEALASDLARLCLEEDRVQGVSVCVEKPGAVRFARSVGVEIERFRSSENPPAHQAYVSIGSNIEPEKNMLRAIQRLREMVTLNAVSTIWETEAVGAPGPRFLNACAWISTPLTADELKNNILKKIEHELGRVRQADKYAPRTIDLDLIVYNEQILDPALWDREFLAVPTAELRPDFQHPDREETLGQIAQSYKRNSSAVPRLDLKIPGQASASTGPA